MDILNLFKHSGKKKRQNIEYFVHLVNIALADHVISKSEKDLLYRIGKNLKFTEHEIDKLILSISKSDYIPPVDLEQRFEQVYEIVKMTLVDGTINNTEMHLAKSFAAKSGFDENEIPSLFIYLINGINKGHSVKELYEGYKKTKKS
jgi:uncharacterized tellurite resistance protein B-like protein